ncbi:hypothetical protein [Fluviispira multicolorata]|uniref:Uncharacterized protein n=1 Tax=Fluviispira multicolorata TaxID=2654512 RepID=A0A833N283_9BACT|nr:hypothetical protein [Fluviispira multicolorata]KAB8032047.1 hypothetical protein GCL57_05205 [Fluviispira multicolorata]
MSGFYAGVVRKKYTLFCIAPDGSQVEIISCYDQNAAKTSKQATERLLDLMSESFDMEEGFAIKIAESMESADDIPLAEVTDKKENRV